MNELNELTDGKTLLELKNELEFQVKNSEYIGGVICSHINHAIKLRIFENISKEFFT